MTWGPEYGGDSSAVQDQLRKCTADPGDVHVTPWAFIACRADGSVVVWLLRSSC